MSDPKQHPVEPKTEIDDLEVQQETVQDLTGNEAEQVKGGAIVGKTQFLCVPTLGAGCNPPLAG
jgi:hypothetical protein